MRKFCTVILAFTLSIPTAIGATAAPSALASEIQSFQASVKPNPQLAPTPSPTATPLAKPRFTLSTSKAVLSTSTSTTVASSRSTGGQIRSFSVSPKLPSGLRLNTSSGEISGKPRFWQKAKKYKVIARNASGVSSQSISIQVIRIPILKLGVLDLGVNQRMKTFGLKNIGGAATTFSISPELPVGLSFNTANGKITGRPTELQPKRTYKISATNISGTSTKKLTIEIVSKPIVKLSKSDFLVSPNKAFSSYTIKSTGGRVYKYSIRPAAPAGMSINSKTGKLVGIPTTPQNKKTYTITATNPAGVSKRNINLEILAPPSFTLGINGTNSDAILGTNVSFNTQWLHSDGGQMSEVTISPALPAGLAFDSSNFTLSGTANGSLSKTNYSLTGKNIAGLLTKTFSLEVLDSPELVMTPKNPIGFSTSGDLERLAVGSEVSGFSLSNSGGRVTSWSVSPALPDGIVLNQLTGEISGAAELEVESNQIYTFTGTNPGGASSFQYRIKLFVPPSFQISSSSENIAVGESLVGFTLESVGGLIESFSISENTPSWLIFDTATGLMTGVASAVQSLVTLTIYATNVAGTSSKTFTLEAFDVPSFSLSKSNESAVNGQAIAGYTISSTGGRITNYTVNPALPEGITLNSETGLISGSSNLDQSPTTYTITGTNVAGSDSHTFELAVYSAPSISLSSTSEQAVKSAFISGYTISQGGGTPTSYQISPAAPAGLTFNVNTGILSGKPTNAQSSTTYTISAINVAGTSQATFRLEVIAAPKFTLSKSSESAVVNTSFTGYAITSTGGPVLGYGITPQLPSGLSFDELTGLISGTPVADQSPITYTITGSNIAGSDSHTFSIGVYSTPSISLSSTSETAIKGNALAGYSLTQLGGTPTSYQITPAAPAGLTFNTTTGLLTGTPTSPQSEVVYTIKGSNVAGNSEATFALTIIDPPVFSLSQNSLVAYLQETSSLYSITSTGGAITSFEITPALPAGLTYSTATGLITGTPTALTSTTEHTITATNPVGTMTKTFNLEVRLTCAAGGICVLGDIGPGGGKIVHVNQTGFLCGPSITDTCHYLEAAPNTWFGGTADPTFVLYGSGQGTAGRDALITNEATILGRGEYNNYAVVDSVGTYATNPCAVTAALNYVSTYKGVQIDDWYLPNRQEMDAVKDSYIAGRLTGAWNLSYYTRYWLSNQYSGVHTNFGDARYENTVGLDGLSSRQLQSTLAQPVRPVRAF